jgi:hypothetical protein
MVEAFARAGMAPAGRRLWAILEEAGLRPLGMIGIQTHSVPGDEVSLAARVEAGRNLVPLLVSTGVATAEEIRSETVEQQVRDEWETRTVFGASTSLSAWATTGP